MRLASGSPTPIGRVRDKTFAPRKRVTEQHVLQIAVGRNSEERIQKQLVPGNSINPWARDSSVVSRARGDCTPGYIRPANWT